MQGQEWVRMVVVGQSFMLHQIRKMVGLAGVLPPHPPSHKHTLDDVKLPTNEILCSCFISHHC